jgi:hypothetical protein
MSAANGALDQDAQACAHSQFFLSDDDGATWRAIVHSELAPASSTRSDCSLWATARHLFMASSFVSFQEGPPQRRSFLERSDDGGRTWQHADNGLPERNAGGSAQPLDATGETLVAFDIRYDNGTAIQPYVWMSLDAGASWRRAESVILPTPPRGSSPVEAFLTEAPFGELSSVPQACHCVVGVSSYPHGYPIGDPLYLSQDLTWWTPLPPLPVKGTSAEATDVYEILGLTGGGRLLVLGLIQTRAWG